MKASLRLLGPVLTLAALALATPSAYASNVATPGSSAAAGHLVATWDMPDIHAPAGAQGPGGHGGGQLLATGAVAGGAHVVLAPDEQASFAGGTWAWSADSTMADPRIDLCLFVTPLIDAVGIFGEGKAFCFANLVADGRPHAILSHGYTVLERIALLP